MQVEWRELDEAERRAAMDAYREAQPIYSRIILRMLARSNRLAGDPEHAVAQHLPMLRLRVLHHGRGWVRTSDLSRVRRSVSACNFRLFAGKNRWS